MKKVSLLLIVAFFAALFTVTSCKKDDDDKTTTINPELLVGRWKTDAAQPYYEVYNANNTGKMWDTAEDVQEDEADTFTYEVDAEHNKMTQYVQFQGQQGVVPQYCNILILNETTLKYNNDALKREVTLHRVN